MRKSALRGSSLWDYPVMGGSQSQTIVDDRLINYINVFSLFQVCVCVIFFNLERDDGGEICLVPQYHSQPWYFFPKNSPLAFFKRKIKRRLNWISPEIRNFFCKIPWSQKGTVLRADYSRYDKPLCVLRKCAGTRVPGYALVRNIPAGDDKDVITLRNRDLVIYLKCGLKGKYPRHFEFESNLSDH